MTSMHRNVRSARRDEVKPPRWAKRIAVLLLLILTVTACGNNTEAEPEANASTAPLTSAEPTPAISSPLPTAETSASPMATLEPSVSATAEIATNVMVTPEIEPYETPIGDLGTTTVAAIVTDVGNYIGQQVTVRGNVDQQIGQHAFSIDEDVAGAAGIDNDLLVIDATDTLTETLTADASVEVTGMVRTFNLAEIEQEIGADLDDALFTDWNEHPVVLAETITQGAAAVEGMTPGIDPTLTQQYGPNITVAEIAGSLSDFTGKQVTVRQEVEQVVGPHAFTLDEDALLQGGIDTDVLVVSAQENLPLINDQLRDVPVAVTGTVRQFELATIEQEIGYDLDDNLFNDWNDRPVIVASGIRRMEPAVAPPNAGLEGPLMSATVAEIAGNAENFVGKSVAVNEAVEEVITGDAFTLDEDALFAGGIDNDLLVVRGSDAVPAFSEALEGRLVQVFGPVRAFDLAAVEQEIGFDLDDAAFESYAGRPTVIVKTLLIAVPSAVIPMPIEVVTDTITIADITGNPGGYLGKQLTVQGEVEEVVHPKVFSLDEDALLAAGIDNDLLVISIVQGEPVVTETNEGEAFMVTGTVRQFITAEIEREYGLGLSPELVVNYEGRPVIIADAITPAQ